jgi:RNA polymerase sigma-B factor
MASMTARDVTGGGAGSVQDVQELLLRWRRDGDESARESLLERYMPLARKLARRYGHSSEPFEDLLQVATVGLLKAMDRYDVERGSRFQSFAIPTILGEMRRYFRDSGWAVHVPRSAQERALKVRQAQEQLANEHGRSPTVNELAQYLELEAEDVLDALQAIQGYQTVSLEAPRSGEDAQAPSYAESIGHEDERYELVELDAMVSGALGKISPRERLILHLRFADDLTQTEIAERVGVSQMQVSRLLRRSIDELRALTSEPTPEEV